MRSTCFLSFLSFQYQIEFICTFLISVVTQHLINCHQHLYYLTYPKGYILYAPLKKINNTLGRFKHNIFSSHYVTLAANTYLVFTMCRFNAKHFICHNSFHLQNNPTGKCCSSGADTEILKGRIGCPRSIVRKWCLKFDFRCV